MSIPIDLGIVGYGNLGKTGAITPFDVPVGPFTKRGCSIPVGIDIFIF